MALLEKWRKMAYNETEDKNKLQKLWADYFVKFLKGLELRGISAGYVSVQNEGEAVQTWDSCLWTGAEEADFAINYLKPALVKNGLGNIAV